MRPSSAGGAIQPACRSERLLEDIRAFGRVPQLVRGSSDAAKRERNLGSRLRKARQAGLLSAAQESELAVLSDATQPAGTSEQLLQDIRAFGRVPHEVRGSSEADVQERNLGGKLRRARQAGLLSAAQEFELAALSDAS